MAQLVKNLLAMWEISVRFLGWEDPLEKGKATHSSILARRSRTRLSDFHLSLVMEKSPVTTGEVCSGKPCWAPLSSQLGPLWLVSSSGMKGRGRGVEAEVASGLSVHSTLHHQRTRQAESDDSLLKSKETSFSEALSTLSLILTYFDWVMSSLLKKFIFTYLSGS